jgi:hypothetical protein
MQWLLQEFDDTKMLSKALDRLGISYSWHRVVPFVGDLIPEPEVADPSAVVLFGSYTLWRYAESKGYRPGVFRIKPFVHETPWQPYMLNGPEARLVPINAIGAQLQDNDHLWFIRPVEDSKELSGGVRTASEVLEIARKVMSVDPSDLPRGSLGPDTLMMLTPPVRILKEWRVWIVNGQVITHSLYKEGVRVTYRLEIDDDALQFAQTLAKLNECYSRAYVMDICRTLDGLFLLETNCINAAGFYAADLAMLAATIEAMAY